MNKSYYAKMFGTLILATLLMSVAGCGDSNSDHSLWDQIKDLGQEKDSLEVRLEKSEKENIQLRKQIKTLSSISDQERQDALAAVKRIEVSERSGLFDKDDNPGKESLIVYVKTTDSTGDVVKMPGSVKVQLWDLGADSNEAKLGEWNIKAADLKEMWASTFMTYYYRLTFDVTELNLDPERELTIKASFTDYFTGRIFTEQKVIKP